MTVDEMKDLFEHHEGEFLKFAKVKPKRSRRHDLHAFLLLDELAPSDIDMVAGAEHDIIYLGVDADKLAKVATEEQIVELTRCGVMCDAETDSLAMFA